MSEARHGEQPKMRCRWSAINICDVEAGNQMTCAIGSPQWTVPRPGEPRKERGGIAVARAGLAASLIVLLSSCQPMPAAAEVRRGMASWYSTESCWLNLDPRCPTAGGHSLYELEAQGVLFAASWDYPLGTRLVVASVRDPAARVRVLVADRGPARRLYQIGRIIDLSKSAFQALAPLSEGIIEIEIQEIKP